MDTRHLRPAALASLAVATLVASPASAATVSSVFGGKVPCIAQPNGVQFCAGTLLTRVESWDGVPLDANVSIPPASMNGPFPLIVDLHGWGIGKTPNPEDPALDGYVVLSYSARGFHFSCGFPAARLPDPTLSNPTACTDRGWIRLADARYEGRDTQYLAGLLADEGLVIPDRIGVTGSSYGGGQSMILAALKNRVMLPDGSLTAWKSPGGLDMAIAAAAPLIPWSDLAYALVPTGRTLDYLAENPYGVHAGIEKQSWITALYALGLTTGFYAPAGADPDADITGWRTRIDAGEPYDDDPTLVHILNDITTHHSAYYIDDSVEPAPLFIYNAFTDDLFPADESLRFWRKTRAKYPSAEVALQYADHFGHPRASLGGDMAAAQARVNQLFARHLKGTADPAPPALETYTQSCGGSTETGPHAAADWDAVHPGEVRLADASSKTFDSAGGNAVNAQLVDPGTGGPTSCRTSPLSTDEPNSATYRLPAAVGAGYTLMGSPTVIADLVVSGEFAEVAPRLWDVAPDGSQSLVAQSLYRPRDDNQNPQVFQLHANGWHFAAGHVAKVELLGQSSPYGRASNGSFDITVSNLELRLPTLEPPDGGAILPPKPPVMPPGDETPTCASAPVQGCRTPAVAQKAFLRLVQGTPRLVWKWTRGAATTVADFGNPTAATSYSFCVYGGSQLLMTATAPAGGTCGGRPCWIARSSGFRYSNRLYTPTGVGRLDLRAGVAGQAKINLKGKGALLAVPTLPIQTLPVTAQLVNSTGTCWAGTFTTTRRNDAAQFNATSD
jgi:hypothetical protein